MWSKLFAHRYLFIFLFALCFHLGFFWLFVGQEKTTHLGSDGIQYMTIADNLLQGHGFSLHPTPPFTPDTLRTPVYPYFLALIKLLTGSFYPTIYLSILFAATIPLAGMGIMRLLKPSSRLELLAGLLLALDPHLWFYGMIYGSEAMFLPLVAWGMYETVLFLRKPSTKTAAFAGLLMGLAALARPAVFFVVILVALYALVSHIYEKGPHKVTLKAAGVFVLCWVVMISPWALRSHQLFGVWDLSNVGWFNMYTRASATAEAIETHRGYDEMRVEYLQRLHTMGYTAASPVEEWDVHGYEFKPIYQKLTIEAIKKYPKGFVISQVSAFFTVTTQDLTMLVYAKILGLIDYTYPSFSPTVVLARDGIGALFQAFFHEFSWVFAYTAIARVGWLVVFIISLLAPWYAWRFRRDLFLPSLFLVLFDLGFIALCLNGAAQTDARYRAQYIFVQVPLMLLTWALWKYRTEQDAVEIVRSDMHASAIACSTPGPLSKMGEGKHYVIIPTYQEKGNVKRAVSSILDLGPEYKVIVVDDGSTDGTKEELAALEQEFPGRFTAIHRKEERSFARSYIEGFDHALAQDDCAAVIECDADGSHPFVRIPALAAALMDQDMAIGSRYTQGGDIRGFQRNRLLLSSAANIYLRVMTGLKLADITAGFIAYRADLLRQLPYAHIRSNGYAFQIDMKWLAAKAGANIAELPISFVDRSHGHSKMTHKTIIEAFMIGLKYRFK